MPTSAAAPIKSTLDTPHSVKRALKDIITLSGDIGGGKSSVARILVERLQFQLISAGAIQREIAAGMGLTTLELNERSVKDRSVDDRIDSYTAQLGETGNQIIVDSRLAWHFIPSAFKVFLSVDAEVGAVRVFDASRSDERHSSLADALENNRTRSQLEATRWLSMYGIAMRDYSNYDLVVDTSFVPPETVAEVIESSFHAWKSHQHFAQLWMSPKRLLALQDVSASRAGSGGKSGGTASESVQLRSHGGQFQVAGGHDAIEAAFRDQQPLLAAQLVAI